MPISMSLFAEYLIKSGQPRLTAAKRIIKREREGYEFAADYYGPLRSGIKKFHNTVGAHKNELNGIIDQVDEKKSENYEACITGYKNFLGRKKVRWFTPKRRVIEIEGLELSINPEIGLEWDGQKRAIKIAFNKDVRFNKRLAQLVLALMQEYLPKTVVPCILDIRSGNLIEADKDLSSLAPLLHSEAIGFASLLETLRKL